MPLITLGDDTKLKLKIPSKGDVDWSDDFKTQFAQKIVDHDHTGLDGKGAKLTGDSLADGAINRSSLLGINLEDLPNVTDAPSNGHTLVYNEGQGRWNSQPPTSDIEIADTTVSIPNGGYASGIVVLTSDIDNGTSVPTNERYVLNFINNGSVNITDYSGVTFIIEDTAPAGKTIKFPALISCTIVSNVDVEFHGTVENCKVLVRRPNGTAKTSLLSNGKFEGSVCDLDELVSAGHASSLTRFVQSSITADILETQMTGTDVENIEKTNLKVGSLLNNSALSTGALRLNLTDKSSLDVKLIASSMVIDGTTVNLSVDSKLTTLSEIGSTNSQIVKSWDDTANRWQYLVSPSGINKVITADTNGEPVELSVSDGHVIKGSSSGLVSQANTLLNLNDVNSGAPSTNQFLYYTGSQWDGTTILQVPSGGSTGQILTKTSSGYAWQTKTEKSFVKIKQTVAWNNDSTQNITIGTNEYAEVTITKLSGVTGSLTTDNGGEGPVHAKFGPGTLSINRINAIVTLSHTQGGTYDLFGSTSASAADVSFHIVVFQNS
jgi:hypothetical protein